MSKQTERNLAHLFSEASKTSARFFTFALKAEREGFRELAIFFKAAGDAQSVHANRLILLMRGKIKETEKNLSEAYESLLSSLENEYPKMIDDAHGEVTAVKKAFKESMATDKECSLILKQAMKNNLSGTKDSYFVCRICGHIHRNIIPDNCPICNAVKSRFKEVL